MKLSDRDRGVAKLERALGSLRRVTITAGVHAPEGDDQRAGSRSDVADVAAAIELGTDEREPRSFVRAVIDERGRGLVDEATAAGERVLRGESVEAAYGELGSRLAKDMKARVPVDTGQTRDAVTSRVRVSR